MGQIADDMVAGFQCSHCGICFEAAHNYPVLCRECFKADGGKVGGKVEGEDAYCRVGKTGLSLATEKEI